MSPSDSYTAFMMDKTSGALSPELNLAADLHVALSVDGYKAAMEWSVISGALFELDGIELLNARRGPAYRYGRRLDVSCILETDFDDLSWRKSFSGVGVAKTGVKNTHFMRLDADQTAPEHGHSALEATVVLEGELDVDGEVLRRGDISLGVPGERHRPTAHGDQRCICFVAQEKRPFWRLT